jgi:LPS sulfotransferase NodH
MSKLCDIGAKRTCDSLDVTSLWRKLRYPRRCYGVCAVARSGSNLLTDGLHATRRAGRPNQFFCELFESMYAEKYRLDPQRDYAGYVRGIIDATVTSNEVFGFKLMGWYLDWFIERMRRTHAFGDGCEMDVLRNAFPRLQLIRIGRRDKLRQAISKARAYQSGQWKVRDNDEPASEPHFDPALIDRCLLEVQREEQVWDQFFQRTGAEAFNLEYEELAADYEDTVAAVLGFLKVRVPRRLPLEPSTVKQADAISAEWEARYREMKQPLAFA